MNRTIYSICIVIGSLLGLNCVTTNINSPGHATRGGEEAFFEQLSDQDDAFESRPVSQPATRDVSNCQCDPKSQPPGYANRDENLDRKPSEDRRVTVDPDREVATNNQVDPVPVSTNSTDTNIDDYALTGTASWYGRDFDGKPTASGEPFDSRKLTGAHKQLPLGTIVMVKNLENDKEVMLKINDRGPYVDGRILDVSEYAAEVLGFKEKGLTTVGIRVIRTGDKKSQQDGATAEFFKNGEKAEPLPSEQTIDASAVIPEKSFKDYSVQVGMFSTLENANRMKQFLQKYNQPVFILKRSDGEYVVRVGQFNERFAAEQLKSKLSADGYSGFVSEPVY